ncbi:MAG: methyltransferase domain-containing protein [Chloroflexi bacterium]|nr:methyltransferase domain-containing protein [Chloroflexota bacterium]
MEEEGRDHALQWASYLGYLDMLPGSSLLDVGCGGGAMARLGATFVGAAGRVVGVDLDAGRVRSAYGRTPDPRLAQVVRFVTGDAGRLPFPDHTFDAVTCVETLGYVANPVAVIAELRRVCKPAGRLVLVQSDWDTQIFNSSDPKLTRRIVAAFADAGADGPAGRQLWGWFNSFTWANPRIDVLPHANTDYSPTRLTWAWTRSLMRRVVVESGAVTAGEYDGWLADLEAQERNGAYFYAVSRVLCTGRIPPP